MPRFSANISMLFKEVEFPERFEAAAQAGFKAVEIQFPYAWDKGRLAQIAQHAGVEVVLINIPAGDPEKGDRGLGCLPGRVAEFRKGGARTIPGFYLNTSAQALALLDEVGAANLKLQYDLFHMRIMGDDLAKSLEANLARIGHMQVADVPDRHEPGTGEIDFPPLFDLIDRLGYKGWIGAEYIPAGKTEDGLAWVRKYL